MIFEQRLAGLVFLGCSEFETKRRGDMQNIFATVNGAGDDVVQSIPFLFVILIIVPLVAQLSLWKRIRSERS